MPYELVHFQGASESNDLSQQRSKAGISSKVNEFTFCTHVSALKSLGKDGTGTLIGRQAMAAREAINRLLVSDIQ